MCSLPTDPFEVSLFFPNTFVEEVYDYRRNPIRLGNTPISQTSRIVCYDQVIYDDSRIEETEYMGLTLDVHLAVIHTKIAVDYHYSAIAIVDDDSEHLCISLPYLCVCSQRLQWAWCRINLQLMRALALWKCVWKSKDQ